ncbi:MAG: YeeE/YedE family protein [Candidatus Eisenbacteria bacterium]|nr:YeeE/YedE family protein [Candidatus Eisenbacteria bacterium]
MTNPFLLARWSPYAVGAGIGVLSWIAFLLSDKAIGCSTPFARASGAIEALFRGDRARLRPYYLEVKPSFGWDGALVIGALAGAAISSLLSGSFRLEWVPPRWEAFFGGSAWARWAAALTGGVLMGFGSRWANGCTSGHGISGTLQLALSGWVAVAAFFAGGVAAAFLLFGTG